MPMRQSSPKKTGFVINGSTLGFLEMFSWGWIISKIPQFAVIEVPLPICTLSAQVQWKFWLIDTRSSITILGLKRWDPWESMASILTCGQICTASPIYIYISYLLA